MRMTESPGSNRSNSWLCSLCSFKTVMRQAGVFVLLALGLTDGPLALDLLCGSAAT